MTLLFNLNILLQNTPSELISFDLNVKSRAFSFSLRSIGCVIQNLYANSEEKEFLEIVKTFMRNIDKQIWTLKGTKHKG